MRSLLMAGLLALVVSDCVPRRFGVGGECELNSECAAPLVCRIGYCRNECANSGDCPVGQSCLLDPQGIGGCQLEAETRCAFPSDCPTGLVCRFNQCTNACETDRDCMGGARCRVDPMGNACIDVSGTPCNFDGECDVLGGEFCLAGRCRPQCFTDRDCRRNYWCNVDEGGACWPLPRIPSRDAGARDGATGDGGAGGCVPRTPLWTLTRAGIDEATIAEAWAGHLLLSGVTDRGVGPGGFLHDLDLATAGLPTPTWITVPFAQARDHMTTALAGLDGVFFTGGTWSTPGGDPYLSVERYHVPSATFFTHIRPTSQARHSSTAVECGTTLLVAGGTIEGSPRRSSSVLDFLDLTAGFLVSTRAFPEGRVGFGVANTATQAFFAGGARETSPGVTEASDTMFVVDCFGWTGGGPAVTERTMPHTYAGMHGATIDGLAYFTGAATGPGAIPEPYGFVEVYDPSADRFTSLPVDPPPSGAGPLLDVAVAGGRLFRAFGTAVQAIDATGPAGCIEASLPVTRIVGHDALLLVISIAAGTATVSAYDAR